jgi:hypothetical protein
VRSVASKDVLKADEVIMGSRRANATRRERAAAGYATVSQISIAIIDVTRRGVNKGRNHSRASIDRADVHYARADSVRG